MNACVCVRENKIIAKLFRNKFECVCYIFIYVHANNRMHALICNKERERVKKKQKKAKQVYT